MTIKDDAGQKTSLHKRIKSDIEEKIFAGDWPPGYKIPTELEFMEQYGCARMTVNKSISALVATGFLDRRKKAGTFVVYPSGHFASLHIPDIRKAVLDAGFPYRYKMLSNQRRTSSPTDTDLLKLEVTSEILDIASLHYAGTNCFAYERRQINLTASPEAADIDFTKIPPSIWLLTHVPWSNAEHEIDAVGLDRAIAEHMAVPPGTPSLKLGRRTWGAAGTITHANQYFLAGSLKLHASFLVKVIGN